jgi:hypothetical protein
VAAFSEEDTQALGRQRIVRNPGNADGGEAFGGGFIPDALGEPGHGQKSRSA